MSRQDRRERRERQRAERRAERKPARDPLAGCGEGALFLDRVSFRRVTPTRDDPELIGRLSVRLAAVVTVTFPVRRSPGGETRLGVLPESEWPPHVPGVALEMPHGERVMSLVLQHATTCAYALLGGCSFPGRADDGTCDGSGDRVEGLP